MDIILYNILVSVIVLIFGYLMGSIPMGVTYCRIFLGKDPREEGSHNPGATNVARVFGKFHGRMVLILDLLKSVLPLWICWIILTFVPFGDKPLLPQVGQVASGLASYSDYVLKFPVYWLSYIGVVVGHCFPIFAKFQGGKGAASILALCFSTTWLFTIGPMIIFLILLKKTKIMSSSVLIVNGLVMLEFWIFYILTALHVLPSMFLWFPGFGPSLEFSLVSAITFTLCYAMVFWRHRANIKRLIEGKENKQNLI